MLALNPLHFVPQIATLVIWNEEMGGIMKINEFHEESSLLIKDVSKINKTEAKEQKGVFLGMLLRTLGASLLGNLLTGHGGKMSNTPRSKWAKTLVMQAKIP